MKIISHFLSLYHFFIIIILTLKTCISFLRRLYKVKVKTNIIQERNVALYLVSVTVKINEAIYQRRLSEKVFQALFIFRNLSFVQSLILIFPKVESLIVQQKTCFYTNDFSPFLVLLHQEIVTSQVNLAQQTTNSPQTITNRRSKRNIPSVNMWWVKIVKIALLGNFRLNVLC